jgi:methyl-accepting chemotaxis protein
MIKIKNIRMKVKLIAFFLISGIIPIVFLDLWSSRLAEDALVERSFGQLESVRDIKKEEIENFFAARQMELNVLVNMVGSLGKSALEKLQIVQELKKAQVEKFFERVENDILTMSKSTDILKMYGDLNKYHDDLKSSRSESFDTSTDAYQKIWREYGNYMKSLIKTYGINDFYVISESQGHVMFTAAQKSDLGTNLMNGPYKNESLARLWRKVKASGQIAFEDFSPYSPCKGQQVSFIGAPVFGRLNKMIAIVALQIPTDPINNIVQRRHGMGKTGETYLVGQNDTITSYRSDRIIKVGKIGDKKSGDYIDRALAGESGHVVRIENNGKPVMISYEPVEKSYLKWAIISTITVEEAIIPRNDAQEEDDFFSRYIQNKGYRDLYLICPLGYAFYSVTQGEDYNTNMLNGKYSKTSLGRLVKDVLKSKQFEMADFSLYPPANNEPSLFIAQPLVEDNEVKLLVALNLPLEAINKIMHQRVGMGRTGETYLVGHDKLMRSDSFLDPILRSVKASFTNPAGSNMNTDSVNDAFSGKTASMITKDYRGVDVLSSFTSINVGSTTWAVLSEINASEIKKPITCLRMSILYGGLFMLVITAILAYFIAKHIADPLIKSADFTKAMSMGDFSDKINIRQKDEIGILADSLNQMKDKISNVMLTLDSQILAVQEGNLGCRADAENFSGDWHTLIVKINDLVSMLTDHIDNLPNPTLIIDKNFTIRYISKAGAYIVGKSAEELIGEKCYDYIRTSDCQTPNCVCAKAMRSGNIEKGKTEATPGGNKMHISYSGVPLKKDDGEIPGVMEVIVDQTAIRKAMEGAAKTATVLIDSVQNLSTSSQEISTTSNEQAAAVKEIVSTMEDSNQLAKSIAAKISEVTNATNTSKNDVNRGFSIIQDSLSKMSEIKNSNLETITEIRSLGERIESIWEIVNMINGIADQTKIIAFNAELEASSAGDAGKNFQIVATEIRRLADSTVSSTGEIKSKISEIQNSSDKLIIASEDGTTRINEGWELSERLQKIFEEISNSSEVSALSADNISVSINQQVAAFEQILITLKQISEGIDNFVVSTRSTTESSEKLKEMADMLLDVIDEHDDNDGSEECDG